MNPVMGQRGERGTRGERGGGGGRRRRWSGESGGWSGRRWKRRLLGTCTAVRHKQPSLDFQSVTIIHTCTLMHTISSKWKTDYLNVTSKVFTIE